MKIPGYYKSWSRTKVEKPNPTAKINGTIESDNQPDKATRNNRM